MTKIELAKLATNIIVGAGTSKIVADVIKTNTDPQNVKDIVTINASGLVLGMMAAEKTKEFTSAKIDEVAAWYKKTIKKDAPTEV